jgi:antitoxin (DNA-binding transcriptional repressor) of toxin-antitoxin stability system
MAKGHAKFGRTMRKVGAFEAKNELGQSLDLVEAGEEVVITRRGRVVAGGVPPRRAVARARRAAAAIRAMSKGVTLARLKVKGLVAEGRL